MSSLALLTIYLEIEHSLQHVQCTVCGDKKLKNNGILYLNDLDQHTCEKMEGYYLLKKDCCPVHLLIVMEFI